MLVELAESKRPKKRREKETLIEIVGAAMMASGWRRDVALGDGVCALCAAVVAAFFFPLHPQTGEGGKVFSPDEPALPNLVVTLRR